jgi:glycosyltransferase involved in cell wall biosynthesis
LPEAIESVLAQDFSDFELVICDNASTDLTPEICGRYSDQRVRYRRFEEMTNQAGSFNRCLAEAAGDFITLLHADDYFLPGFLTDRVARLEAQPETSFVFGAVQVVDSNGSTISTKKQWAGDRFFRRGELFELLLSGCLVSPPSLMVRRSCIDKIGPFRTDLTWGHDWEWTLRLSETGAAFYVAQPLAAYREHDASGTAEILNAAKNGRQERLILSDTIQRCSVSRDRIGSLRRSAYRNLGLRHMYIAEQALLNSKKGVALNNLWYAAAADPAMLIRATFWALVAGSIGSPKLYARYRSLRNAVALPASK